MNFLDYLKQYQKFVYNTFYNALKNNKVSQAYLIKGSDGAPVFECAKFLAKSLICDNSDFACDECIDCIRFDEGNYSDIKIIDGNAQTIKVGDIEELQVFLSSSSLEKKGLKIYIINELENANKESINALLKTLEEPYKNTYAFITTKNESKILQTILSRCQILNLLPIDKGIIKEEVIKQGVNIEDAEILSHLYSNTNSVIELSNSEIYNKCKSCLFSFLEALTISKEEALFVTQTSIVSQIKSKEEARLFFELLSLSFKDILYIQTNQIPTMQEKKNILEKLSKKYKNIQKYYLEIMLTRGKIEINISIALLLEHICIYIIKGGSN